MGASYKADNINPPQILVKKQAGTDVIGHRTIVSDSGASGVVDLGTAWIGRYVTFNAEANNVRVIFGWTSGITAAAGTSDGGSLLYAGAPQRWIVTKRSRFMAHLSAAATTYVTMYPSSPE